MFQIQWRILLKSLLWFYAIFLVSFMPIIVLGTALAMIGLEISAHLEALIIQRIIVVMGFLIHVLAFLRVAYIIKNERMRYMVYVALIAWMLPMVGLSFYEISGLEILEDFMLVFCSMITAYGTHLALNKRKIKNNLR